MEFRVEVVKSFERAATRLVFNSDVAVTTKIGEQRLILSKCTQRFQDINSLY
jgi:hypothetical protein